VSKTSSLPIVVYQTAIWGINRILSIKQKKKIYIFLNSYLKRLRKSNEINYVNKIGLYIPSKILTRLERFILANEAFRSFVVEKIYHENLYRCKRCPWLVLCRWWCIKVNRIFLVKPKKKIYTFLNSYLKRLRKGNKINYVKKMGSYIPSKIVARLERFILIDEALRSFVVEKIYHENLYQCKRCPWLVLCRWWCIKVNRIFSVKPKKKIDTILNSYLKRLRKSNEINYVKKMGSYIPSKIVARLERFILAD